MEKGINIAGIGLVFARGRGIDSYEEALQKGWISPLRQKIQSSHNNLPAYCLDLEAMDDKTILKKTRRAGRFSKMAVLAAHDAVCDSGVKLEDIRSSLGIIVATAFGAHATTFRFLNDIIDYGDDNTSPTMFSNSVHSAAGSYVASTLGIRGPTVTVTQFVFSLEQALILAQCWIKEGRCGNVLVGCVDEFADVMEYICSKKLNIAEDGKIKPFQFSKAPLAVPGEGSVFFLLRKEGLPDDYCKIRNISFNDVSHKEYKPDMYVFQSDGIAGDETAYKGEASRGVLISAYAPIFGSMLTGSGFNCAAAALMLKRQKRYSSPVQDNPHSANLCTKTEPASIEKISCVRYDCVGKKAEIRLEKSKY